MKIMNIDIQSSEVLKTGTFSLVQYEVNVGRIVATFSPEWEGLSKVVTFYDAKGEKDVPIPMMEEEGVFYAIIPPEATRYGGNASFVIDGYKTKTDEDGEEILDLVIRTKPAAIKIYEAPKRGEGEPGRISPTDYERLLNLINALSDKVGKGAEEMIQTAIEQVINGAPEALDTLNELSKALGDDPNFATTVLESLGKKADEESLVGKKAEPNGAEIFNDYENNKAELPYSHAEGSNTYAGGQASHAEGCKTKAVGDYSHAEGYSAKANSGYCHAEGYSTLANGGVSHAEGAYAQANGSYCHAEGYNTVAKGSTSHAEGAHTEANGEFSHAEGFGTIARGSRSHAQGLYTIALGACQFVDGKFNIEDTENKYAHITGGGTSSAGRANIHTLDWEGNAWFAGRITVGKDKELLPTQKEVDEKKADVLIKKTETAKELILDDSAEGTVSAISVFGDSNQDETPSPSAPVDVVHIENPTLKITDEDGNSIQELEIPYTLMGIKDKNGNFAARDEIVVENGKVKLIQRCYKYVFSSKTAFTVGMGVSNNGLFYRNGFAPAPAMKTGGRLAGYGNFMPSNLYGWNTWNAETIHFGQSNAMIYLITASNYGTKEELYNYLSNGGENEPYIIYQLAAPIVTDITETECGQALLALYTNYPSTVISCDADFKVSYKADTTNAYNNLLGELDTLKQAIINLGGSI